MNTVTPIFKTLKTLHCGGGVSLTFGSKGTTVMQEECSFLHKSVFSVICK